MVDSAFVAVGGQQLSTLKIRTPQIGDLPAATNKQATDQRLKCVPSPLVILKQKSNITNRSLSGSGDVVRQSNKYNSLS